MDGWKSEYFRLGEHFLSPEDVSFIEERLHHFPLEAISIGDAGELNNCKVGRLMEDHPQKYPEVVNPRLSGDIIDLYRSEKAISFFKRYFPGGVDCLYIRRAQFNLLSKDSFVGRHLDIDSNPTYKIAAVLQLGSAFTGGEFIVYRNKNSKLADAQVLAPEYGSLTISFCSHEHEVSKVSSGTRTSLVFFYTDFDGVNPRVI